MAFPPSVAIQMSMSKRSDVAVSSSSAESVSSTPWFSTHATFWPVYKMGVPLKLPSSSASRYEMRLVVAMFTSLDVQFVAVSGSSPCLTPGTVPVGAATASSAMQTPLLLNGTLALNDGPLGDSAPFGPTAFSPHAASNARAPAMLQVRKKFLFILMCLRRHLE